jgi:hypothetical protein
VPLIPSLSWVRSCLLSFFLHASFAFRWGTIKKGSTSLAPPSKQTHLMCPRAQINLPLATRKTAARTHVTGMDDLPVSKHMEQSFGNASVANCTFGNVSWQCSLFKLCQSSSKCDNVIRRSCHGIMAKHNRCPVLQRRYAWLYQRGLQLPRRQSRNAETRDGGARCEYG